MTLFDGITARAIETPRLMVNILERERRRSRHARRSRPSC